MIEDRTQGGRRPFKNRLKLEQEYKILGMLGTGGMAEVYKAEQTSLNRIVAIKKLKPSLRQNPEMLERFFREAQSAAHLQHENIIQVYQMGELEDDHFIVMEYVEGLDLRTIVKTAGRIPWEVAGLIARGVAQGLSFAHQRGFIHRDIKSGNIMLSYRGEVKIMDFGIVRRIDSELTQTGAFLGTPSYMSPEQLKGKGVTPLSDLYSLGVVLYEVLTGDKPFKADTEQALILKITTEKEKSVRAFNPEVPWRFARLVKRLLKKNPEKRFKSAEELIQALDRILGKKLIANPEEIIAGYLRSIEPILEEDKTKRTAQADSEPVQLAVRAKTRKLKAKAKTVQKGKEEKSIIGNEWEEPVPSSSWMVKTIIMLVVILALILLGYLIQSQGYLESVIDFIRSHF